MQRVIYDCDNTIGLAGRDVDDGLAILYLLGRKDIHLVGITTTFGNGSIEDVYCTTLRMFDELGIESVPVLKGAGSVEDRQSEASWFLSESVRKYPNQITLLATGALANLYAAWERNNSFFRELGEIIFMGGVTAPLFIGDKKIDELNISCDPEAAYHVFNSSSKITAVTGNLCLQAPLERDYFMRQASMKKSVVYRYIKEKIMPWFTETSEQYGIDGFYVWDVVAAVYLTNPELFFTKEQLLTSTMDDLNVGVLKITNKGMKGAPIIIPSEIREMDRFWHTLYSGWENALRSASISGS